MARWRVSIPWWVSNEEKREAEQALTKTLLALEEPGVWASKGALQEFQEGESRAISLHLLPSLQFVVETEGKRFEMYRVLRDVAPRVHEAILTRQFGALCFAEEPHMDDVETYKGYSIELDAPYTGKSVNVLRNVKCRLPSLEQATTWHSMYVARRYRRPDGKNITELVVWNPHYIEKEG